MATAATASSPSPHQRRHFPVYETPKTCEHAELRCALTSTEQCCACLDKRPLSATERYDIYIDGRGTVNEGTRWGMYCGPCKEYWETRSGVTQTGVAQTNEGAGQQEIQSHDTRQQRRRQLGRNAFGTLQEISSEDYVSPVTSMFQRAVAWRQNQRRLQQERDQNGDQPDSGAEEGQSNSPYPPPQDKEPVATVETKNAPQPLPSDQLTVNIECKVCFSQVADTVFLPCAHLAVCEWCADEIAPLPPNNRPLAHTHKLCPICRQLIKRKLKVFRV
ncbi:hypothetical protein V1508DRAFT_410381 [Lipomyces doorenjongii]|uniref:uncharacterized protein n=1 Tax=Lipomyces doorenjongii TaxID=383834 RepID=UPI0034CDAFD2